jgi:DNA polymerase-3 subunit chi
MSTTPQIAFHTNVRDKTDYICRLIRKANASACRIIVLHDDAELCRQLDEALWTFSDVSFLPHVLADDIHAEQTPIILAHVDSKNFPHHELLINLSQTVPNTTAQFERVIEIVSQENEDKQAGRLRYKQYQQLGFSPSHIEVKSA